DIRHVRQARERKPVCRLRGSERPNDARPSDALAHVRIRSDVLRVVEVDEVEMADRGVERESDCYKAEANPQIDPRRARRRWRQGFGLRARGGLRTGLRQSS